MNPRFTLALVVVALGGCATASSQALQPSPSVAVSPSPGGTEPPSSPSDSAPAAPTLSPAAPPTSAACHDPHEHVYSPDRLRLINPCMTVTGRVEVVRNEPDGDYHILLRLDPAFANLVNQANLTGERGDLVLEPVCELPVTQRDAVQACVGVSPTVPRPVVGLHYSATGAYVLDQLHGWMELHPLWDLHSV